MGPEAPASWLRSPLAILGQQQRLTLDIHNGVARIVLFQGNQVLAWRKTTLSPHAAQDTSEVADQLSTEQLRDLLGSLVSNKAKLVTSLPSSLSLLRELRLPKISGKYLKQVVMEELLKTVPFSQAEVDVTWRLHRSRAGIQVWAALAPALAVDRHMRLLRGSGATPKAAYPRPIALAFASGVRRGILLNMNGPTVDLALVQDGFPVLVHQLEIPSVSGERTAWVRATAQAIQEVAASYPSQGESEQEEPLPVVLSGEMATRDNTHALQAALGQEVQSFPSPFLYPESFPVQEYAANLGLALADQAKAQAAAAALASRRLALDLLPMRHRAKPFPVEYVAVLGVLALIGSLALFLTQDVQAKWQAVDTQAAKLQAPEQQARLHTLANARAAVTQKQLDQSVQVYNALKSQVTTLDANMQKVQARLNAVAQAGAAQGIAVSSLDGQKDSFLVSGAGISYQAVLDYTTSLRASGLFTDVKVLQMQSAANPQASSATPSAGASAVTFQAKATN